MAVDNVLQGHTTVTGPAEATVAGGLEATDELGNSVAQDLPRGATVGRYIIVDKLGAGGMGVVYAAFDPELGRRVAIKLLRAELGGDSRIRLLREAQALAQLDHPNVVTVHDVGAFAQRVWLAMEFIEGETFGAWCQRRRPGWREVLDVMTRAGHGLAAAHRAGLIHRDFKPDNVMVGRDDRVRVMDLGLARREVSAATQEIAVAELDGDITGARPELAVLGLQMTRAGAVLGTPAYMAPEQFIGGEVGAAADIFAYCVTFWEALNGERPFEGATFAALAANVVAGRLRPPRSRSQAPSWLRRAIERGLHVDPEQRWPTMQALLDELARGQSRARLRLAGAALVGLALVAGAAWAWRVAEHSRRASVCAAAGASIDEVWNDGARDRVRAALSASGARHAGGTAERVLPWLDEHALAWRTVRTEACLDADLRGAWSPDTLDRALWCLDERRMELESLVGELAQADAATARKAISAAAGLERVEPCRDVGLLARLPVPPARGRESVRVVRAQLARASSHRAAGHYAEGLAAARAALTDAEALDWPPLAAAARYQVGELLADAGQYAEAETVTEAAYFEAAEAGAAGITTDAAVLQVDIVGSQLARHADAHRWARLARLALRALEPHAGLREVAYLGNFARLQLERGEYSEAGALHEQALARVEQLLGPDHPQLAVHLDDLANVRRTTGAYAEARALDERALAIRERALGPDHPELATTLNNLGNALFSTGAVDEAIASHTRALQIRESALGPEHPDTASSLNNLATIHYFAGHYPEAREHFTRALRVREAAFGPQHPDVADSLNGLATLARDTGAYDEALTHYGRALAIREAVHGPEHAEVAGALSNLARVHRALGHAAEARDLHLRGLAIVERAFGPDHTDVAKSLDGLASVQRDLGALDEARALYERALAIWDRALGPDHPDTAWSLVGLARVHLDAGALEQARARAEQARTITEKKLGTDHPDLAPALHALALVALAERRPADALAHATRALDLYTRAAAPPQTLAEARFTLARALADDDRDRARELAGQAHAALQDTPGQDSLRAEISAWLARR